MKNSLRMDVVATATIPRCYGQIRSAGCKHEIEVLCSGTSGLEGFGRSGRAEAKLRCEYSPSVRRSRIADWNRT